MSNQKIKLSSCALFLLFTVSCATHPPCVEGGVCVLIPEFEGRVGQVDLGDRVTSIVSLQVLEPMRLQAPGSKTRFVGDGKAVPWPNRLKSLSHAEAERLAGECRPTPCAMTLWGNVYPLDQEAVVLSFLSIPQSEMIPEWSVEIDGNIFAAKLPSRRYSFNPIGLNRKVVQRFPTPANLLCEDGTKVGGSFKVEEWTDLTQAKVKRTFGACQTSTSPSCSCKLDITSLLKVESGNAVNFTSGVVRAYRQDWCGAAQKMIRVIEEEPTPTSSLKIHAAWFLGWSLSEAWPKKCLRKDSRRTGRQDREMSDQPIHEITLATVGTYPDSSLLQAKTLAALAGYKSDRSLTQPVEKAINDYCAYRDTIDDAWLTDSVQKLISIGFDVDTMPSCQNTASMFGVDSS